MITTARTVQDHDSGTGAHTFGEEEITDESSKGCSIDAICQTTSLPLLERLRSDEMAGGPFKGERDYVQDIEKFHTYLDMVKIMVRPGCSGDVLKVALDSLSSIFDALTSISSVPRPHASL